ncbi:MAG TPA: glycosyltransferase family 4 protein [Polyangiaceae bacterium]|jgi:glycosyltransferase involved in cell wall biosynthesis
MPRVFHVLRKFEPAEWGGIETHLVGLIPELAKLGWESEVHAPAEAGTDGAALQAVGATFRPFRARYPYLGMNAARRARLVAAGGNLLSFDELGALLRAPKGSIFHVHTQGRLGGVVRTAARLKHVPYAVSLHGPVRADAAVVESDAVDRTRGMIDLGAPAGLLLGARRVVHDADLVFTLNRHERDAWSADRAGRHLALVSHGVALAPSTAEARREARALVPGLGDAPFAVTLARLDRAKGQDLAIEALARGAPEGTHYVLAGAAVDATYAAELRALAAKYPRVHVLGGVSPRQARALLAEAKLALLPSRAEPFGIVLLEAWAEGTPALAADVGGLGDIARTTGAEHILVKGGVEVWAERVRAALGDSDTIVAEGAQARARVARHYSWRSLAEQTAAAYQSALTDARS